MGILGVSGGLQEVMFQTKCKTLVIKQKRSDGGGW
jgi:hypothetical protein